MTEVFVEKYKDTEIYVCSDGSYLVYIGSNKLSYDTLEEAKEAIDCDFGQ